MSGSAAERRWRWVPAALFLGLAGYGFLRSHVYRPPGSVHPAMLHLRTLDGKPLPGEALTGRVTVLNFWAPWCPPCREEMPWLDALQRDHPEVAVLGVEDDPEAVEQARALEARNRFGYQLVLADDAVRAALGHVPLLPTTLYISASGRVVHTVSGVVPRRVMEVYLKDASAAR